MPEASNGLNHPEQNSNDISWKLGPREFVLKNLKFIPWVIICGVIGAGACLAEDPVYNTHLFSEVFHADQKSGIFRRQGRSV